MGHAIEVNNIRVYAHHGCLAEETKIGAWYRVDIRLETDFSHAFTSDDLNHTIDYVLVNKIVETEMAVPSKLIEHVGNRIVSSIQAQCNAIISLKVKVIKYNPPINGDVEEVAIEITL